MAPPWGGSRPGEVEGEIEEMMHIMPQSMAMVKPQRGAEFEGANEVEGGMKETMYTMTQ